MAGRIPEDFINDLIERADIVDVIGRSVPLRRAGQEFSACCPFHDEKTPSFFVSPRKQFYHCFGCGATGSVVGFLMAYHNLEFREAVESLAEQLGVEVPQSASPHVEAAPSREPLREALEQAQAHFQSALRKHPAAVEATEYLKGRGLTGQIARDFGIGFAAPGWDGLTRALKGKVPEAVLIDAGLAKRREDGRLFDMFRHRVTFPIRDARGRLIGFGGRAIGDDTPKYLNSPETRLFSKGRELYNLDRARREASRAGQVLVVEGYMDVIALAQFGVEYAVATLGTAATREHCEKLFRVSNDVVFCFDGDNAGRRAARRAAETCLPLLRDGRSVGVRFLPNGEDPDSLVRKSGPDSFNNREGVTPLAEYLLESLCEETELDSMSGRARLVSLANPLINLLPEGALKGMMLERLAEIARTRREDLSRLLVAQQKKSRKSTPPRSSGTHSAGPVLRGSSVDSPAHGPAFGSDYGQNPARHPDQNFAQESLQHSGRNLRADMGQPDGRDPGPSFDAESLSPAPPTRIAPPDDRLLTRALQIVVQIPESRTEATLNALAREVADSPSLRALIDLLTLVPGANTGQLHTTWQAKSDAPFPQFVLRPLGPLSETGLIAECEDAIQRIGQRRAAAARREVLATVGNLSELSEAERVALRQRLAQRLAEKRKS